jgi:ABC-type oligopeptide transport system substrate-binding subunit
MLVMGSLAGCSKPAEPTTTETTETTTETAVKEMTAKEAIKILDVRKALTLAIDRTAIVETVTKAGQIPATGFVPTGLKDSTGNDFRETAGDYGIDPTAADVEGAQKLLADAGFPNGEGFPTLTLLYNTSEGHKAIAEAIQEMWKQNLSINVEIQNQEWAVFQDTRHQGNFEVARAGWIGDYEDPMTFLDLFTTYSGNNDAQWFKPAFDEVIEASKMATGTDRDKLLYEAEKMMMDDMIVLPIYYYTHAIAVKDEVKDWYVSTLGHWFFGTASTDSGKLVWNLGADPKTLDPGLNSAADGGNVINNMFEGLMRKDDEGIKPGIAESYDISADGKTYTFHLRDSKWSDGQPLTAGDFEYAWKRALDPALAAEYGFQMFYIEGAQNYYEGNGTIEDVKVKATDDRTLEVTLAAPTPYFLDLTTFYTFMPVRKDLVEANPEGWAKDPKTFVSNGPFMMADYKVGDRIVLTPNKNWWRASEVKLTQIDALMIVDQSTALTAYEANEIQVLDSVPVAEIPRLLAEEPTFKIMPYVGTYYYIFNVEGIE